MTIPATYAWQAVHYAQGVLGITPANHIAERIRTLGGSTECVQGVRSGYQDRDRIMNIRRLAGAAKASHCGNCGEYAAVTFDYLMLTHCPYAIEYASYVDPGDHAFVIVGRPTSTNVAFPASWGTDVVIADAWAGNVVSGDRYWIGMPQYPHEVHLPQVSVRYHAQGDFPVRSGRTTLG